MERESSSPRTAKASPYSALQTSADDEEAKPVGLRAPSFSSGSSKRPPPSPLVSPSLMQRNLDGMTSETDAPLPASLLSLTGQVEVEDAYGQIMFGTEGDIGEDAWAAAMVAIVRNLTVISMKRDNNMTYSLNIARMAWSLIICAANLSLQFGLLVSIHLYLVEPQVSHVQARYNHFLSTVFDDGHVLQDAWGKYDKDEICSVSLLKPAFYYAMLAIWTLTQVNEIRNTQRMFTSILALPTATKNSEMLSFIESGHFSLGGKCHINKLTTPVRIALIITVVLPRGIIAFCLTVLGCRWLTATSKFSDMILNSLALEFVISIDELLFVSILPAATRVQIANTKLFFAEGPRPKSMQEVEKSEWAGYRRSVLYVLCAMLFLPAYGMIFQSVLPADMGQLRGMCAEHITKARVTHCDLMAFMDHTQCYGSAHSSNIHGP
eukprot:TRINITY_DN10973_c0_g1_i1.p1 TRINITY_DN10973_c0_g1~~TRINITY_DN10973_c0_g1_i1.p1  ORF type:complete len:436 (+),score=60.78 TRINITY_DN10973_c0_g1_i1:74-1381(+)